MQSSPTADRRARVAPSALLLGVAGLFVATLVTSNIIAAKVATVGPLTVTGAIVVFPLAYLFGDILTEVWGYAVARMVIWVGFGANLLMVGFITVAIALPAAPSDPAGAAYGKILGVTWRLVGASLLAYLVGEFLNCFIFAKVKVWTRGRHLWARTIGSTMIGQGVDSVVFIGLVFGGVLPGAVIRTIMLDLWVLKVAYEVAATPLTYAIVTICKRVEGVDADDRHTDFAPIPASWRRLIRRAVVSA